MGLLVQQLISFTLIQIGSDADVTIVDTEREETIINETMCTKVG
jgi:dihydroorotase-like cyclic amidohydrolase